MKIATAAILMLSLVGCGNERESDPRYLSAYNEAKALSCELPKGNVEIHPIGGLKADDFSGEKLAREKIELLRRKTNDSWELAARMFYGEQAELYRYKQWTQDDRSKINNAIRIFREAHEIYPYTEPIDKLVLHYALQYKSACTALKELNSKLQVDEAALASLRAEKNPRWLDQSKHLPCLLQQKAGCKE